MGNGKEVEISENRVIKKWRGDEKRQSQRMNRYIMWTWTKLNENYKIILLR